MHICMNTKNFTLTKLDNYNYKAQGPQPGDLYEISIEMDDSADVYHVHDDSSILIATIEDVSSRTMDEIIYEATKHLN